MVQLVRENRIVIDDVALLPRHIWESYSGGNGTKDSWDSLSQGIAYVIVGDMTINDVVIFSMSEVTSIVTMFGSILVGHLVFLTNFTQYSHHNSPVRVHVPQNLLPAFQ